MIEYHGAALTENRKRSLVIDKLDNATYKGYAEQPTKTTGYRRCDYDPEPDTVIRTEKNADPRTVLVPSIDVYASHQLELRVGRGERYPFLQIIKATYLNTF